MAKVDQLRASSLFKATKTMEMGANKSTIRILYGSNVAEGIEFKNENRVVVKKGVRTWCKSYYNRRVFSAVIDISVNYFGFDPLHPQVSFRNIDFNRIMGVIEALGYSTRMPELNKLVEALCSLSDIEGLGQCEQCERPYIVSSTNDSHCSRCRLTTVASALSRYSTDELEYD
ncbi:hypothetical protein L6R44_11385 [Enterobacter cloacae complex sp. ECC445]|uniref:hypothetical protein n=1 Tax=Enterobacter cloacae complex sp. ECC445 TaxID=2913213 RepID=UPI001F1C129D|nr:hypothetical protein [Enterobacter cloacae complex sp. ECC445]MCG0456710.1 hypothetical protein [Enterobacter cloacae complex sp. ECC445]